MQSIEMLRVSSENDSWIRSDAIIKIANLRLRTYIGFNPEEQNKKQDLVINCELAYAADFACFSDDELSALNYKTITKKIINHVEQGKFKLLEKLADNLLGILMENNMTTWAKVTVDKPHALRFSDSVSVTISASRS